MHCASSTLPMIGRKRNHDEVRLVICSSFALPHPDCVLLTSSASVCGDTPEGLFDESTPPPAKPATSRPRSWSITSSMASKRSSLAPSIWGANSMTCPLSVICSSACPECRQLSLRRQYQLRPGMVAARSGSSAQEIERHAIELWGIRSSCAPIA